MPRSAGWKAGAFAPCGEGSIPCATSEPRFREDRTNSPGQELAALKTSGEVGPALVLKDPYILDFLGLRDRYIERDFEDAILRELEMFPLELGAGFSFIARQKRIQLDGEDFYIDLLFYSRKL
jgi:predicted nuclease of restriction endonuclease-like (RecB) superfamily